MTKRDIRIRNEVRAALRKLNITPHSISNRDKAKIKTVATLVRAYLAYERIAA